MKHGIPPQAETPGSVIGNQLMEKESVIAQLKFALQALSLEAEDQLASFPDFVVVTDELLLEFDNWYKAAVGSFPAYFSEEQLKILKDIDVYTESMTAEDLNQSIEDELRTSPCWKELRNLAKEALVKFNWSSEIPPYDRGTYIKG